jgi:RNA polymerase sigma-70 factor (ECF subfamily)
VTSVAAGFSANTLTDAGWTDVVREHSPRVVAAVMALGLDRDRAGDIVQQTWTELFAKIRRGELGDASFPGLAIRHARYRTFDLMRADERERRRRAGFEAVDDVPAPLPTAVAALTEAQVKAVKRALAACSPTHQQVFRLVYARPGLPHGEVAAKLGLSVQRVRQSMCELRRKLRAVIAEEDV